MFKSHTHIKPTYKLSSIISNLQSKTAVPIQLTGFKPNDSLSKPGYVSSKPQHTNTNIDCSDTLPAIVISKNTTNSASMEGLCDEYLKWEKIHLNYRRSSTDILSIESSLDINTSTDDLSNSTHSLPSTDCVDAVMPLKYERSQSLSIEKDHQSPKSFRKWRKRLKHLRPTISHPHLQGYQSFTSIIINKPPANLLRYKKDIFLGKFSVTFEELNQLFMVGKFIFICF